MMPDMGLFFKADDKIFGGSGWKLYRPSFDLMIGVPLSLASVLMSKPFIFLLWQR